GERTDFNRVRFHIETDGSISSRGAFSAASKILQDQFTVLAGALAERERQAETDAEAAAAPVPAGETGEAAESFEDQVLKKRVEDLELSTRTLNTLLESGVKTVGMLAKKTEKKLREIEGMGDKGVVEVKKALGNLGLTLKQ
ncbi:MAG: DNA-directed RNA polymerase subunit alpha C-terminal domain-containing protein, partial [Patescibacteria group bacterium]